MEKTSEQVPVLRFAGFKGPWKTDSFGALAEFTKGKGISKQDISDEGDLPCIRYAELYTVYGEVIDDVVSRTALEADGLELSQAGDVIIPASGETAEDIARAACVKNAGVALGGDLNIIRSSLDGTFLAYHLNGVQRLAIASLAQGKSVVHLYPDQLRTLDIRFPTLPEQQKIAAFLGAVDRKIQQLKRKQSLLEQYKKGVVQLLFSQELRFKRVDGSEYPEWDQAPLEELFTANKGFGLSREALKHAGKHKCLLYGELFTRYKEIIPSAFSSTDVDEGLPSKIGDILMPNSTTTTGIDLAQASALLQDGVRLGGDVTALRLKVPGDSRFWAYYITHGLNTEIAKYAQGITIVHLSFNNFKEMTVPFPCVEEQIRIAGFLMALDAKVAGVARAVEAAQKWKKGLLQQMFV